MQASFVPAGREQRPESRSADRRVSDLESASMWQSLSFGANYKAAYCLANRGWQRS